jgi:cardiolipin synthase
MKKRKARMIAFLVTAFYVAGILSAIHAALTVRTAQGAVAWTVSLVSFPFVAVPAYLVLGRNKFEGMAEAFNERQDEIDEFLDAFNDKLDHWVIPPEDAPSWHEAVRRLSGFELTRNNRVDLLINGEATFDSILAGVAEAQDYVLFQFYMFHDDGLGRQVKAALIERARAGVRVFVLYDEVGSGGLPKSYVEELRQAGVEVSSFKPTQGWQNRFQLNFRNHRKMVVVDGKVAWVGGHNVGDEYMGRDPDFSPWRDTHVRIEGPAALQLQITILSDWYWATRELPDLNWTPHTADDGPQRVMILPTGLRFRPQRCKKTDLAFGGLLRAGRRGNESPAIGCATRCGRSHHHHREAGQLAGLSGGISLHPPVAWAGHQVLRLRAGVHASEGHAG